MKGYQDGKNDPARCAADPASCLQPLRMLRPRMLDAVWGLPS
ncbi:hypothetical protein [Paraburkholderia lycopersici]|nr:hypothetical protein [Paraburkholderia lycopersici]